MNAFDPRLARVLGLSVVTDEQQLEKLSAAELEAMETLEFQQVQLIKKLALGTGIVGSLAARKLLPSAGSH